MISLRPSERSLAAAGDLMDRTRCCTGARCANPLRRRLLASVALWPATLWLPGLARAAGYPVKPVRIIIPFAAGGTADQLARMLGNKLGERLGQPVVVESKPGANGIVGTDAVAKAVPDGHTLLLTNASHAINPAIYSQLPYDSKRDFAAIAAITQPVGMVLAAHPSVPARSAKELIALAHAKPGEISFGSSGTGSALHLAGETLGHMAGVKFLHVPYKGAAPALTDLLGGQIHLMFNSSGIVMPLVRSGKLAAIGQTGAKRMPELPGLSTIAEDAVPGYEATSWFGLFAPAATPAQVVRLLAEETLRAMQAPDMREKLAQLGVQAPLVSEAAFARFVEEDTARMARTVRAIGLAAETPR